VDDALVLPACDRAREVDVIGFRRILCPVDFSEFSRHALTHAVAMARRYEGRVTLLYVAPLLPSVLTFPLNVDPLTMDASSREGLGEELREFAAPLRDQVPMDMALLEGDAARQILEHARQAQADLVVMGTHGRSGFERWALGSVTEKVLRKAHCPVLTVPRSAPDAESGVFHRILCPVDFSPTSILGVKQALSLAEATKASLTLLHVVQWMPEEELREHRHFDVPEFRAYLQRDALRQLHALIPDAARDWCEPREVVAFGKPWRQVLQRAAEDSADLIVMGVNGRGAVDLMLFGSTTHHAVREATCPVLTVRGK
jgi:nucleotide-binding universal stress UspA family protein